MRGAPVSGADDFGSKYMPRFAHAAAYAPSDLDSRAAAEAAATGPRARLELEHVYGYAGMGSTGQNLFYTRHGKVVFYTAAVGIVAGGWPAHEPVALWLAELLHVVSCFLEEWGCSWASRVALVSHALLEPSALARLSSADPLEASQVPAPTGKDIVEAPPVMTFFREHTGEACVGTARHSDREVACLDLRTSDDGQRSLRLLVQSTIASLLNSKRWRHSGARR